MTTAVAEAATEQLHVSAYQPAAGAVMSVPTPWTMPLAPGSERVGEAKVVTPMAADKAVVDTTVEILSVRAVLGLTAPETTHPRNLIFVVFPATT